MIRARHHRSNITESERSRHVGRRFLGPPHHALFTGRALADGGHALGGGGQEVHVARPPVGRPGLPPAGNAPSLPVGDVLGEQCAPYLHHGCEGGGDGAGGGVAYRIHPVHRVETFTPRSPGYLGVGLDLPGAY